MQGQLHRTESNNCSSALLWLLTSALASGELCLLEAVQRVQDHSLPYLESSKAPSESASELGAKGTSHPLRIYSHICGQELRKVSDSAKLDLTGKPGVLCAEGLREL